MRAVSRGSPGAANGVKIREKPESSGRYLATLKAVAKN
nr:MAG TPA: hypothetical protein [Caudoviricetes sp.]